MNDKQFKAILDLLVIIAKILSRNYANSVLITKALEIVKEFEALDTESEE